MPDGQGTDRRCVKDGQGMGREARTGLALRVAGARGVQAECRGGSVAVGRLALAAVRGRVAGRGVVAAWMPKGK